MKNLKSAFRALVATGLFVVLIGQVGCGGNATASGENSYARGGDVTVSPTLNLALGDTAIKAASDALAAYRGMHPGALTQNQKEEAVSNATSAGVEQARKEGKSPTAAQQEELKQAIQKKVF